MVRIEGNRLSGVDWVRGMADKFRIASVGVAVNAQLDEGGFCLVGDVLTMPPVLRIAWSDGEAEGLVRDEAGGEFTTRKRWEAEVMLFKMVEQYRGFIFWIVEKGSE